MIDLYCERLGPGAWAEPINASTNLAFLLAAWLSWRAAGQARVLFFDVWLLIGLSASIAVGSALFHTLATTWAHVLDVAPILMFQLVFLWIYCRRIVQISSVCTAGLVLAYLGIALWARQFPQLLNGSLGYAPAFLVLVALGIYHFVSRRTDPLLFISASGVFLVSLVFRTADAAICPYFPVGTHFLWHLCNALLLYLLTKGLISNLQVASSDPVLSR